ncbi:MAG: Glycosyltransferase Gtf1 [Anaerolineae bacterium]|nr:Glycosyltransferase Gtf1 [Anaerolineae bacterium]
MRICILIDSWQSDFSTGGGHVAVWQLAMRLVKNHNCRVDLVTGIQPTSQGTQPKRVETYLDGALRLIRVGPCCFTAESLVGKLLYCAAAIPFVIRQNYDLINAQAFAPGLPGWVAARLARVPVIYTIQGIGQRSMTAMVANRLKAWLLSQLENLLLFKIKYDYEISVSADIFEYANVNQNITVIPNGVDVAEFDAVACKKASKFQILFVGRIHPQKGLLYLVEAMREVVKVQTAIRVLIVGTGAQLPELRRQIRDYGLEAYFEFTGHLTGVDKIRAFKSSHLFVLPSLYEGQPLTLLEAWAARLPVIVTEVGANPDFVKPGINGYLVPPKQPRQLAEAIVRAIDNPELVALGKYGYDMVQNTYTWDAVAEQTYHVCQQVLAESLANIGVQHL